MDIPVFENKKISWFLSCSCPGFKIYQIAISCFLEDIDLISKLFKISLDGSSGFSGARLFKTCQTFGFPSFGIDKDLQKYSRMFS